MMDTRYYAARLHPSYNCILEDILYGFGCHPDSSPGASACSVFVWENSDSNTPGDWILHGSFIFPDYWPQPGYWGWLVVDASNFHIPMSSDFWIGYKKMQDRVPYGVADDSDSPSNRNIYRSSPVGTWNSWTNGDYGMRGVVSREYPTYWPISGDTTMDVLTSAYGPRDMEDTVGLQYDFHRGTDIQTGSPLPVYAVESGKVVYSDFHSGPPHGFGDLIVIKHRYEQDGIEYYTYYAHLSDRLNTVMGDRFNKGEQIAVSGNTGGPYAHHLHFGLLSYFDPEHTEAFEDSAKHPLRILPHTDDPDNYILDFLM